MTEGRGRRASVEDGSTTSSTRASTGEAVVVPADKGTEHDAATMSLVTYLDLFCCYNTLWDTNFTLLLITINARRDEAGRREPQLYAARVLQMLMRSRRPRR